jgi:phosphonate transport system substrate-binding protein
MLLAELGELHLEPAGRQILSLFKINQLLPFQEAHLATVRELWSSYTRLQKEARP